MCLPLVMYAVSAEDNEIVLFSLEAFTCFLARFFFALVSNRSQSVVAVTPASEVEPVAMPVFEVASVAMPAFEMSVFEVCAVAMLVAMLVREVAAVAMPAFELEAVAMPVLTPGSEEATVGAVLFPVEECNVNASGEGMVAGVELLRFGVSVVSWGGAVHVPEV